MRRRGPLLLALALAVPLAVAAVPGRAQEPPDGARFTPRPPPTPLLPKLTPVLPPDAAAPPPATALPPPVLGAPLAPVAAPADAAPAEPAPAPAPAAPPPAPPPAAPAPAVAAPAPPVPPPRPGPRIAAPRPTVKPATKPAPGPAARPAPDRPAAPAALPAPAAPRPSATRTERFGTAAPPPPPPTAATAPPRSIVPPAAVQLVPPVPAGPAAAPVRPEPPRPVPPPAAGPVERAVDGRPVWVTREVWVRAAPTRGAAIVDGLAAGTALEALPGGPAGWTRVARDGRPLGYVSSGFLGGRRPAAAPAGGDAGGDHAGGKDAADGDGGLCQVPDGIPAAPARIVPPGTVVRALTDAYIRAAPTCGGRVLDVLEEGDTVTVTGGGADGWYRIRGQGWERGYIGARLLAEARRR
ncbi:SH3 domain-containing protein [Azospirillum sp. ST 5-10]|uniref:SH3 domain-containing protein n=1 Tax=unclassified Azospirillum TaxID=2630922 RepID=UPI003F4A1A22